MQRNIWTLIAALTILLPGFSRAASLTGYVAYTFQQAYSVVSTDLKYPDGTLYSELPVFLICIDHTTQPPFDKVTSFFSEAGVGAIKGDAGAAGVAAIHWVLENYYDSHIKHGTGQQQRALQYALWEIGNDYDGSAASINTSAGKSHPDSGDVIYHGDPKFIEAYQALYESMKANLPSLSTAYRSTTYTIDLFNNQDPKLQNMAALIEKAPPNIPPVAVPSIAGTTTVGSPVTGTYTYADSNSDLENPAATAYKFVSSPHPTIANSSGGTTVASGVTGGAEASVSYTLQPTDLNQYLYYCVTPAAITGATPGLEVCTAASGQVAAPVNVVPTATPTISGAPQVGATITGNYTYADKEGDIEAPAQTLYTFVTSTSATMPSSSGGTVVATGSTGGEGKGVTYIPGPSDLNKYLYFCVTPAAQTGATPGLEVCTTTAGQVAAPVNVVPTATPAISGVPQVGTTITGNYTYADKEGDIEAPAQTVYTFVTSTSPTMSSSSGGTVVATGSTGGAGKGVTYIPGPSDLNKYLYFCVTPAAQTGATPGLEVCTVAAGPVVNAVSPQAPTPVPSLGQWALVALTFMLGLFGIAGVRPGRR